MEIYHCICQYTKIPYEYCTTFKPLARIGQYRAHQTRPATNYKGALRDGIELHLTASEEKMPRFLLTATATDGQQKEFKSITSITLGSRGLKSEFNICDAFYSWKWNPSCIVDGKNKLTRRIATLIYLLVDKLQKLVSLRIVISNSKFNDTPCFPRLIRRQLHQYPLNRPFRLRFSSNAIALWL
ncbi:unnamed protein product [Adineta steineri]|uniref:Uncharacterized protein n=1 Tax=Adineta steineri TaxID=433720 RepID=A0A814IWA7_9BILA|nr:unnamed protein product [Adineta steineri]